MINYIKMDLYKLFKGKALYICMLIFLGLLSISVIEMKDMEKEEEYNISGITLTIEEKDNNSDVDNEMLQGIKEGFEEGQNVSYPNTGIGMDTESVVNEGITLGGWMRAIYSGNLMINILLIVMAIFICNDFSGGFIKNTINIPKHKWYVNFSKIVSAMVVFLMQNIIGISVYLFAREFVFEASKIGGIKEVLIYILIEMLLYMGIVSIIMFVCNITRSKAAGIISGMIISIQLISASASVLLDKFFDVENTKTMKMFMSSMATMLTPDMNTGLMKEAIGLGVVGIFIWFTLSNVVITKKDI